MADFFTQGWANEVRSAVNSFPDDEYRQTKLDLFWNWIVAAREGFTGSVVLSVRDMPTDGGGPRFLELAIDAGQCTNASICDELPADATYVLAGDYDTWRDILANDYDCGKAVMYRRFRLEKGDLFRFFNRIYFFTESLVALSKVPTTLPA